MATFALNDETKYNSYGFRIPNEGLKLDRFKNNPVMLDGHFASNDYVIGRWNNIRVEGNHLKADDEYDLEDDRAKNIKRKVDKGFIRGASLGLVFDRDKMQVGPDGKLFLSEAEVLEASIVAVPANSGALRLYAPGSHELLSEEEVKLSVAKLKDEKIDSHETNNHKQKSNKSKMEKFMLTAVALTALGLKDAENANEVSTAIENLHQKYQSEKTAREALQAKFDQQTEAQANALVDNAIAKGQLTADLKEQFVQMAKSNYELAAKVIKGMPEKKSLAGSVSNSEPSGVKSLDDFQKMSVKEQLAFKADHPEEYKALVS